MNSSPGLNQMQSKNPVQLRNQKANKKPKSMTPVVLESVSLGESWLSVFFRLVSFPCFSCFTAK